MNVLWKKSPFYKTLVSNKSKTNKWQSKTNKWRWSLTIKNYNSTTVFRYDVILVWKNLSDDMTNVPTKWSTRIAWVDTELTGLDVNKDVIMEIACVITEQNLDIVASKELIVSHSYETLSKMNEWCKVHHKKSGLTEACLNSKLTLKETDDILLDFVQKYTPKGECMLAGNTIYMDRWFLQKQLPNFNDHFHYRLVDVSTIKELIKRWKPEIYSTLPKKKEAAHRAMSDIEESIAEMRRYKDLFFQ